MCERRQFSMKLDVARKNIGGVRLPHFCRVQVLPGYMIVSVAVWLLRSLAERGLCAQPARHPSYYKRVIFELRP